MTADIEVTCVTRTGSSHIDYLVTSVSARPFILGIQARLDVPWGTHCGLVVQLAGSGQSLVTRALQLPAKLPQ
eukprot:5758868-Pyramimonas_sp.AAC.1